MDIALPKIVASDQPKRGRGRPSKEETKKREEQEILSSRLIDLFPEQTPQQRIARITERFDVAWRLIRGVINGVHRSIIISGAPGIGKSHTVSELLSQAATGEDDGLRPIHFDTFAGSKISGINLYMALHDFRAENCITMIDDSDSIYDDEVTLNLLKTALESKPKRRMRWPTQAQVLKQSGIGQEFDYEGSMVFITNKNMQAIVDTGKSRLVPHFQALMSRSLYLDLQLHSIPDLIVWVEYMVKSKKILQNKFSGISPEMELEAVEWAKAHATELRELSIRTVEHIAKFMLTDPKRWQQFARVTLLR